MIYLYIYILFLLILGTSIYLIVIVQGSNCNDWGRGLNNTSIINNITLFGCQIQFPKKCTYKPIYFFMDYTSLLKKTCKTHIKENSRENLIEKSKTPFITPETKHFGYPLSNKDPKSINGSEREIYDNNFYDNLVDMDNVQILEEHFKNKIPEVSVDFTNNIKGKIDINIYHDEKLSKVRKLLESNSEPYSNNVLIIYIDAVSRQNAMRELKKTLKFFEKFMPYQGEFNENYPNENYHSFEFFKYHTFKGHTSINFPLLFYGQNRTVKNKVLINKYFKENGYVTSLAHDSCIRDNTMCNHEYTEEEVYDHEFNLCDPNRENINLNTIRCLYGKQDFELLLDYTDQFWRKYESNRKFSLLVSNYGHEGTLQLIKHVDDILLKFITNLFNDHLLKDTTLFLMSDHGAHMPSLYFISDFYNIEKQLPMLYILVNDRKNIESEKQYKYMRENQQNFITAFDFYNTLGNIIYGDKYKDIRNITKNEVTCKSSYGESLFNKIKDAKKRNPKNFLNFIDMELFACK